MTVQTSVSLPENPKLFEGCLKNKVILITGASDGIGRALAISAAQAGAEVILVGKTLKKLNLVYDEICALGKNIKEPMLLPVNLLQLTPENTQEIFDAINTLYGKLDGLVHLAGDLFGLQPISLYDIQKWQQTIHLHLHVPFLLTQALLPLLKKSESGSIIFTTDSEVSKGKAYYGAYACAKSGIETLANLLQEELENSSNISVSTIYPGKVGTRLRRRVSPDINFAELNTPEQASQMFLMCLASPGDFRGDLIDKLTKF
jgi:NAD(P)-dependent dehydrogenase (short-subunit alcohol dehydrogenase family)